MTETFKILTETFERLSKTLEKLLTNTFEKLTNTFEKLISSFEKLTKTFEKMTKTFEKLTKNFKKLIKFFLLWVTHSKKRLQKALGYLPASNKGVQKTEWDRYTHMCSCAQVHRGSCPSRHAPLSLRYYGPTDRGDITTPVAPQIRFPPCGLKTLQRQ